MQLLLCKTCTCVIKCTPYIIQQSRELRQQTTGSSARPRWARQNNSGRKEPERTPGRLLACLSNLRGKGKSTAAETPPPPSPRL